MREVTGEFGDAHDVRAAVVLIEVRAHAARQARERNPGQWRISRKTPAPIARPPSCAGV
jgi:hypothetical protein